MSEVVVVTVEVMVEVVAEVVEVEVSAVKYSSHPKPNISPSLLSSSSLWLAIEWDGKHCSCSLGGIVGNAG